MFSKKARAFKVVLYRVGPGLTCRYQTRLERLEWDKPSSLFFPTVSDKEDIKYISIDIQYYKQLYFMAEKVVKYNKILAIGTPFQHSLMLPSEAFKVSPRVRVRVTPLPDLERLTWNKPSSLFSLPSVMKKI